MSVPVEAFRMCLLGRGTLGPQEVVISIGITAALLISGVAMFQRVERTVVDSA
jgi:ABC-type polysaccharide/polyol phosphate export permease